MAVNPLMNIGVNAVHAGIKGLQQTAQDVAELNISEQSTSSRDAASERPLVKNLDQTAEALLDLKLYQRQVESAARIVETADEVLGFLLDTTA